MLVGDVAYLAGFLLPMVAIASWFYWWYSTRRGPDSMAPESAQRRHKTKAIIFSILIFVVLLMIAAQGAKSTSPKFAVGDCVSASNSQVTGTTSCSGKHFGKVVAIVGSKILCPTFTTEYMTESSSDPKLGSVVCIDSQQ